MATPRQWTRAQRPVVTEERTSAGWSGCMTMKRIPDAIAARPAQRTRFAAVGFICVSPCSRCLPHRDHTSRCLVTRVGGAFRLACLLGINLRDGNERQAEVAHALEQAVQRGL